MIPNKFWQSVGQKKQTTAINTKENPWITTSQFQLEKENSTVIIIILIVVVEIYSIETFRFKDEDDYEYEIWLSVFSRILKI